MESYESRHSDFEFTGRLAAALGVTRPPLRIDSQAKYGEWLPCMCSSTLSPENTSLSLHAKDRTRLPAPGAHRQPGQVW
jgi:hypothetical protein